MPAHGMLRYSHARCFDDCDDAYSFYCMVLLTALFASSCYWQPLPSDSPLTYPLGNATTFAEALNASYTQIFAPAPIAPPPPMPHAVQLIDRCWCAVGASARSIFDPVDLVKWERDSVERTVRRMGKKNQRPDVEAVEEQENGVADSQSQEHSPEESSAQHDRRTRLRHLLHRLRDIVGLFPPRTAAPTRLETTASPSQSSAQAPSSSESEPPTTPPTPLPLLRREYNLHPYGFDMVLDFGWGRSH